MTDQRNAASRQTETDFYYPLIIEQWNRRGVTNVEMARRLGKSVSLIGKVKSGRASFTAAMQIRVMEILEIDRQHHQRGIAGRVAQGVERRTKQAEVARIQHYLDPRVACRDLAKNGDRAVARAVEEGRRVGP